MSTREAAEKFRGPKAKGDRMPKTKSLEERLFGAAVLKMSFRLRGAEGSPAFTGVYPGVLRDLALSDAAVESYIEQHRADVEAAARGSAP
jgi:hypothetical protein